jgi:hypothetical protein
LLQCNRDGGSSSAGFHPPHQALRSGDRPIPSLKLRSTTLRQIAAERRQRRRGRPPVSLALPAIPDPPSPHSSSASPSEAQVPPEGGGAASSPRPGSAPAGAATCRISDPTASETTINGHLPLLNLRLPRFFRRLGTRLERPSGIVRAAPCEHEFGVGTIAGLAAKFEVPVRAVRQVIARAMSPPGTAYSNRGRSTKRGRAH